MTNTWRNMLLAICLIAGTQSFAEDAEETAPDALVKGITSDVIAAIKQDKDIQAGSVANINALVEARILRGGIRPGEDRFGVEDLRCQSRRHEPRREL